MIMSAEHLTEQQIAQCADAMAMEEFSRITPAMRTHLEECEECATQVNVSTQIVRQNFSDSLVTALGDIRNKKSHSASWVGVAAALIIIVGLAYVFRGNLFESTVPMAINDDSTFVAPDSITQTETENTNASLAVLDTAATNEALTQESHQLAYVENADLEQLTNRFRSANDRGEDIEIITPIDYTTLSSQLTLKWKMMDNSYVNIELFDNTGKKIEEVNSRENSFKPSKTQSPGLYYWKLSNEDFDLLFCGKITITEE